MYKIIFSPKFNDELDEVFEYISKELKAENAAKGLMSSIDKKIMSLKDAPYMYPLCPEPLGLLHYRKIAIKNYILIYSVDNTKKEVHMLRCFYGKRNYLNLI